MQVDHIIIHSSATMSFKLDSDVYIATTTSATLLLILGLQDHASAAIYLLTAADFVLIHLL